MSGSALTSQRVVCWLWDISFVACLLFVGQAIRASNLEESLWLDELHTAWSSSAPQGELASRSRLGNQPPLYFWLVSKTIPSDASEIASTQQERKLEASIRSISLWSGLVLLILIYAIVIQLTHSRLCAGLSLFLAVFDPELAFYSQEARAYAVLQLATLIHLFGIVILVRQSGVGSSRFETETPSQLLNLSAVSERFVLGNKHAKNSVISPKTFGIGLLVGTTLAICVWLHFVALLVLVADALVISFVWRRWKDWLAPVCIGALAFSVGTCPLWWTVVRVLGNQADWSVIVRVWPAPSQVVNAMLFYGIPSILILWAAQRKPTHASRQAKRQANEHQARDLEQRGSVSTSQSLTTGLRRWRPKVWSALRRPFEPQGRMLLLLIIWAWGPVCLAGLLSLTGLCYLYLPRYLSPFWPAMIVSVGLGFALIRSPLKRTTLAVALVGLLLIQSPFFNRNGEFQTVALQRNENWQGVISQLNQIADKDKSKHSDGKARQPETGARLLYFFPNLVEDSRILSNPEKEFQSYVQFPLDSVYVIDRQYWFVINKPVRADQHFFEQDLDQILEAKKCWLVIRGQRETLGSLLDELGTALNLRKFTFDAVVDAYGMVAVVEIDVRPWEQQAP